GPDLGLGLLDHMRRNRGSEREEAALLHREALQTGLRQMVASHKPRALRGSGWPARGRSEPAVSWSAGATRASPVRLLAVWSIRSREAGDVVLGHRGGVLVVDPCLLARIMRPRNALLLEGRSRTRIPTRLAAGRNGAHFVTFHAGLARCR